MAHHGSRPRSLDHSFHFPVDKEVGIQLTERQRQIMQRRKRKPFETQSNQVNVEVSAEPEMKPRSSASTSVVHKDHKALLRKVLASKQKKDVARSTVSSTDDQKAYLRQMLASSKRATVEETDADSGASSAATSTQQDENALLRKALARVGRESGGSNGRLLAESEGENIPLRPPDTVAAMDQTPTRRISSESKERSSSERRSSRISRLTERRKRMTVDGRQPQSTTESQDGVGHVGNVEVHPTSEARETEADKTLEPQSHEAGSGEVSTIDHQTRSRSVSLSPDETGFASFMSTLKREVAGDHTELWRSFQTLFRDENLPPSEKPKRVKFDSKTKQMLTEMNLHVKRSSDVECVVEAQLVNDRKLAKEEKRVHEDRRGSKNSNVSARRLDYGCSGGLNAPNPPSTQEPNDLPRNSNGVAVKSHVLGDGTSGPVQSKDSAVANDGDIRSTNDDPATNLAVPYPNESIADSTPRGDEVSESEVSEKENCNVSLHQRQQPLPILGGDKKGRRFAESDPAIDPIDQDDKAQSNERQKSWLTSYRKKQAMGSLLDQTGDSQPHLSPPSEQPESSALDSSSKQPPTGDESMEVRPVHGEIFEHPARLMNEVRQRSLLDGTAGDEKSSMDTGTSLSLYQGKLSTDSLAAHAREDIENIVPWANVKLRSAARIDSQMEQQHEENPHMVAPCTGSEHPPQATQVYNEKRPSAASTNAISQKIKGEKPPWTPVQLRSVQRPENSSPDMEPKEEQGGPFPFRVQLRKVPSELNAVKRKAKESELTPKDLTKKAEAKTLADLSWVPAKAQSTCSAYERKKVYGIDEGQEVSLSSLPKEAFESENDALIVELDRIPGMPEEHKISVVMGSKTILTARSVKGEQLSRVIWCLPRSDVKSLTLDLAEKRADLALTRNSSKSLVFETAEACLHFANAFYEKASKRPMILKELRRDSDDNISKCEPAPGEASSSEQLNEEEQRLLEAYRQKRKTKTPDEAMREAMGEKAYQAAHPERPNSSSLNDEEEKIASTYRKMLKFSVPADAVRHKMTKEGVSEKIIASVLDESGQSIDATTGHLSAEDEAIAETYRKMLKLRIPPDAVRHKMTKDQVDSRIVDAVLGSSSDQGKTDDPPKSELSGEEEELAGSYRKMLKMMIPAEAVRHKMKKDQASQNVIIAVFGPDAVDSEASQKAITPSLSEEEEAIASTYRKMLKMMIPPDAVRHKMTKDQIDAKIVMVVLGPDPNNVKSTKSPEKALSEADEQTAETYRKMLRMKVPRDGVRHKMNKNGVSEKVITAVLGADINKITAVLGTDINKSETKSNSKAQQKSSAAHGSKLVSLHWTPLSGEALDNSVWKASKKRKDAVAQPEGSDISKLVELFQKKKNKRAAPGAEGGTGNGKSDEMAKLIDLNRANNLAISLKAFKEFSHKELTDTIAHLDPLRKITGERVQFMKDLLPTPAEIKIIKEYKGDECRLVPAEQFFRHLVQVQRLQTKVQVMQTMDTLNENAIELGKNFVILEQVCSQIMNSAKLEEVLDMVLQIGNIMNEGTRTGGAAGFKFDSLLKLTQTKSSDGKMTVLDYIVMIFVAKDKRETLQLTSDFPDCQVASRMMINDMVSDVLSMKAALKKCQTELDSLKKDNGEGEGIVDPRKALLLAIQKKAGGGEEPEIQKTFSKRDAFLAAIEARSSEPGPLDGKPAAKEKSPLAAEQEEFVAKDASLKSGIQRLEGFISEATTMLKKLEEERDRAIDACKSLSRYCGESGGERATSTLIGILSQFATNLEHAVVKHDTRREAEQRREAAQKKKEEHNVKAVDKNIKSTANPTKGQSLVLMVNELLKEAPDDAKEDFKKGVVYEDPDEKLRAIYQRERESLGIFVPSDARKPSQVDLLIAIKKRRERAEAAATPNDDE